MVTKDYTPRSSGGFNRDAACKQMVAVQILKMILSLLTRRVQKPLQFVTTRLATPAAEGRDGFILSDVSVDTPRGGSPNWGPFLLVKLVGRSIALDECGIFSERNGWCIQNRR
jgi:hypothetical protein